MDGHLGIPLAHAVTLAETLAALDAAGVAPVEPIREALAQRAETAAVPALALLLRAHVVALDLVLEGECTIDGIRERLHLQR